MKWLRARLACTSPVFNPQDGRKKKKIRIRQERKRRGRNEGDVQAGLVHGCFPLFMFLLPFSRGTSQRFQPGLFYRSVLMFLFLSPSLPSPPSIPLLSPSSSITHPFISHYLLSACEAKHTPAPESTLNQGVLPQLDAGSPAGVLAAGPATLAAGVCLPELTVNTILIFTTCWVLFCLSATLHFLSDHAPTPAGSEAAATGL